MRWVQTIPLFAYLLLVYNLVVFAVKLVPELTLNMELWSLAMMSGAVFSVKMGEALLMIGVIALYVEIFKATRGSTVSIFDHLFSMLTFVGFLVEYLLVAEAATAVFFTLMLMALLDVVAGFTVTIASARRDIGVHAE
ncbi:MAG: hypothetical protein HQL80_02035 [Magnetococcales bacterium]|nr:hypothetical protein [Magnetococcales bacterium]MBF0582996.1 hypothetical protein [Magnetococcales bacterium]